MAVESVTSAGRPTLSARPAPAETTVRSRPAFPRWLRAFALYLLASLLTVGWYALSHPSSVCACIGNADPAQYMWSLQWYPYALVHGLDPFMPHVVWAPTGINIARAATIPTAAYVLAPVTALFGPIVSYNVLTILSPALTGLTTYLLCRRITGRELPALAGGLLFAFGNYDLTQLIAHPNLFAIFLIPAMVHLAVRRVEGDLSRRAYIVALAVCILAQLGLSTELLATAVAVGGLTILLAACFVGPTRRPQVWRLLRDTVLAGLLAAFLASPFLYYALFDGGLPHGPGGISDVYGLDLLNPFIPTRVSWLLSHAFLSLGLTFENANIAEADGYLTIPFIAAFFIWYARTSRRVLARLLLAVAIVTFVAALGSHLHIAGFQTIALPYQLIRHMAIADFLTPSRIIMYTTLAMTIGVAAWLAEARESRRSRILRWGTFALIVALLFPNIPTLYWGTRPSNPSFFATAAYKRYLVKGEMLVALPYGADDNSELWQAETNFYFSMPEGYFGNSAPTAFALNPAVNALGGDQTPSAAQFLDFVRQYHVRDIAIDATVPGSYVSYFQSLGLRPITTGGIILFTVPPSWR